MSRDQIQKLIDAEKPAFEYARMFLTTVAWWTLLIVVGTSMMGRAKGTATIVYVASAPILAIGGLFGLFLLIRINLLTERLVEVFLQQAKTLPVYFRVPLIIVVSLMPLASAWLIVWALMFSDFAK